MRYTITGVIPVAQYANVQPTIEVEAETWEEARRLGDERLREIWDMYAEDGKRLKGGPVCEAVDLIKLTSPITGGTAWFNERDHTYIDDKKKELVSGSMFASRYKHPFLKDAILPKISAKHDIPIERIAHTWQLKSEISTDFGNAVHKAMHLYGEYAEDGKTMNKEMLSDHPFLRSVVESFYAENQDAGLHEVFVLDAKRGLCGVVDRLVIVDKEKKLCRVQDFKTNGDIRKQGSPKLLKEPFTHLPNTPLGGYHLQLNFYADILEAAGWTVRGIDLFHLVGTGWETHSIEREKVTNSLEENV